ncbi:DinB family protein [Weeksellaceae bacterium KMM 9724]|uniref:DinB family protein n=1 Tax=Profundicola chukchiensis TaxID=2961959 RepID=UPI00243835D8|nr:DinB family protein [Profundicola chukchiensis]MDG4951170.1 DinB family protein [Profundicola chukchiensis]
MRELLNQLNEEDYCTPMEKVFNSTIGKHTRHIIEFYQLFLKAYDSLHLCYDERSRNINVETSINDALFALDEIIQQLDSNLEDKELQLKTCILGEKHNLKTSVSRELLYLLEHTTHHLASIRIGVSNLNPDFNSLQELGVAYSTPNLQNS